MASFKLNKKILLNDYYCNWMLYFHPKNDAAQNLHIIFNISSETGRIDVVKFYSSHRKTIFQLKL